MPPLSVLIKPVSGNCNLRCKYCFYFDEAAHRTCSSFGIMSEDTTRILVDRAMAYADYDCTFAFQGGEPTLRGIDFYRNLSEYIYSRPNPKGLQIHFAFQTNGVLLDDDWAKWFSQNDVLVGISLDGPKEIHDLYRVDQQGKGTFNQVMAALHLLERYHINYNILTVVSGPAAKSAQRIYNFFKKNRLYYQQYIGCLDPLGEMPGQEPYSLTPAKYLTFLKSLFDIWYLDIKNGKYIHNRYFEDLLRILDGQYPESCNMRGRCSCQWVIEADGSVYPCDFYVLDEWRLGNILTDDFRKMAQEKKTIEFVKYSEQIPPACKSCRWLMLCRNGCRRDREPAISLQTNKNRFCSTYQQFFDYAYPKLMEVYQLLLQQM